MINKITVFECDTCKRQIELEIRDNRPYPNRCAITYKCPGLYQKIGTKNSRTTLFPPIVYGIQDYIQRGTVITKVAPTETNPLVPLLSGDGQLVLAATSKQILPASDGTSDAWAVNDTHTPTSSDTPIFLYGADYNNPLISNQANHPMKNDIIWVDLYELSVNTTAFSEFYFLEKENSIQVFGADDSTEHVILRFTNDDSLVITINGIQIPRYNGGPQDRYFKINADESTIPENAIKFIPALSEASNAVKIYVYKTPTLTDETKNRTLVFRGVSDNDSLRSTNAWGDISRVEINFQESSNGAIDRFIYTCSNLEVLTDTPPLNLNFRYLVRGVKAVRANGGLVELDPQDIHLLFGQPPYSFTDKVKDITLSLSAAINPNNGILLEYFQDEFGNDNIYTYKNNLSNLIDDINMIDHVDTSFIENAGAQEVNQADTLISSKYIIGYV